MVARKPYGLETLVKDPSVKRSLKKALDGDGRLTYDEVQSIIYSTCDGPGISKQEVSDLKAILDNSRSIDARTKKLIDEFVKDPASFFKFRGFPTRKLETIIADLLYAKRLSQQCASKLVLSRTPKDKLDQLLRDTFSISLRETDKVRQIQSKFLSFRPRMEKTVFIYKGNQRKQPGFMSEDAWVVHAEPFNIYVAQSYFRNQARYRAALLIHEYIHHVNDRSGHPGGDQVAFGRTSIGLPFIQAVKNPWCYQYFAMWSNQV
ncbi:hypothetical protein LOC67_17150 [Stieleria sp. JC731]|uniref:hypothetical protein n=1 Tax=Pirellulaceae TaxID=2691357 RepID=UPI001E46CE4B|nr:hypothetical protein [Stieleria sp. JC731]MCC9602284.1 hypothetical protein [Stieleria sp. JC731]